MNADDGPGRGRDAVLEGQIGPGALQQRLGDEEAETQAALLFHVRALPLAGAGGYVGLADASGNLRREAGAVIGDNDVEPGRGPLGADIDPRRREIDRVLHQIPGP